MGAVINPIATIFSQGHALTERLAKACAVIGHKTVKVAHLVGHHDRTGGGGNPTSWSSAHGTRGCSQENLQSSGGDGLFYCFAVK